MNRPPRLLFASWHCTFDPSSGAAMATRDLLELLATRGWDCRLLCGPALDFHHGESVTQLLADQGVPFQRHEGRTRALSFSVFHGRTSGVPAAVYLPGSLRRSRPTPEEGEPFLALFERTLERFQPDLLLTYGGNWLGWEMMLRAKRRGVSVVFALHNLAYTDPRFFELVDTVLVPSRFSADHYRRTLGIECTPIPSPVNWSRIRCKPDPDRQFVTFVNPTVSKGVFVFARIAEQLSRRGPDIPLLIVEGRSGPDEFALRGLDLGELSNLHRMANTPDPRDFYQVSRMILMPSLCNESFGRVAAEAQINGIPVLASNRGALPEVVQEAAFLFNIPDKYTAQNSNVPTAEDVAPWVETVIRLWDDPVVYARQRERIQHTAQRWRPERIAAHHEQFFRNLAQSSLDHGPVAAGGPGLD